MNSKDEHSENLLRTLIAVFGVFFGGWWTNLLIDIFNSPNIVTLNKAVTLVYPIVFFISFYLAVFIKSWGIQTVIFAIADSMIGLLFIFLFSPTPAVGGEAFLMKVGAALITLVLLQVLILHYMKLIATRHSNEAVPPPPPAVLTNK